MEAAQGHRAHDRRVLHRHVRRFREGHVRSLAPLSVGCPVGLHGGVRAVSAKVAEVVDGEDGEDAHEDEHDDERVEHARDRAQQRHQDLVQRLDALEEAEDAKGAKDLHLGCWAERDPGEREDADDDDDDVEGVPRVGDERAPPRAVHVDQQLDQEDHVAHVVAVIVGDSTVDVHLTRDSLNSR